MSHVWCHGPECHTKNTQDRVRGSKGSKVLRTRKLKRDNYDYHKSMYGNGGGNIWNYFCSHCCQMDFAHKHAEQIIKIEPRTTPLETPIHDPKRTEHSHAYHDGRVYKWTTTEIKKIDNDSNVG